MVEKRLKGVKLSKLNFNKSGLSPVIATILLIMLALALIAIVLMWMMGFFSEQIEKGGKSIEQVCDDVAFEIETDFNSEAGTVDLKFVNTGNVVIYGFEIKSIGGGNSDSSSIENLNIPIGDSEDAMGFAFEDGATRLVAYPIILGTVKDKMDNKPTVCSKIGETIRLDD